MQSKFRSIPVILPTLFVLSGLSFGFVSCGGDEFSVQPPDDHDNTTDAGTTDTGTGDGPIAPDASDALDESDATVSDSSPRPESGPVEAGPDDAPSADAIPIDPTKCVTLQQPVPVPIITSPGTTGSWKFVVGNRCSRPIRISSIDFSQTPNDANFRIYIPTSCQNPIAKGNTCSFELRVDTSPNSNEILGTYPGTVDVWVENASDPIQTKVWIHVLETFHGLVALPHIMIHAPVSRYYIPFCRNKPNQFPSVRLLFSNATSEKVSMDLKFRLPNIITFSGSRCSDERPPNSICSVQLAAARGIMQESRSTEMVVTVRDGGGAENRDMTFEAVNLFSGNAGLVPDKLVDFSLRPQDDAAKFTITPHGGAKIDSIDVRNNADVWPKTCPDPAAPCKITVRPKPVGDRARIVEIPVTVHGSNSAGQALPDLKLYAVAVAQPRTGHN